MELGFALGSFLAVNESNGRKKTLFGPLRLRASNTISEVLWGWWIFLTVVMTSAKKKEERWGRSQVKREAELFDPLIDEVHCYGL
jgi:hypothetical protein